MIFRAKLITAILLMTFLVAVATSLTPPHKKKKQKKPQNLKNERFTLAHNLSVECIMTEKEVMAVGVW